MPYHHIKENDKVKNMQNNFLVHSIEMKPLFQLRNEEKINVLDVFQIANFGADDSLTASTVPIESAWKHFSTKTVLWNLWRALVDFVIIIFLGCIGLFFETVTACAAVFMHVMSFVPLVSSSGQSIYDNKKETSIRQSYNVITIVEADKQTEATDKTLSANEVLEFFSAIASFTLLGVLFYFLGQDRSFGKIKTDLNVAFLYNNSQSTPSMQSQLNNAWQNISKDSCANLNTSKIGWGNNAEFELFSIPTSFYELDSSVFAFIVAFVLIVSICFQFWRSNFLHYLSKNDFFYHDFGQSNYSKWAEYFLTSALQLVIISNGNLVQSWFILILLFAAQLSLIVFGLFIEVMLHDYIFQYQKLLKYPTLITDSDKTKIMMAITDKLMQIVLLSVFCWILHLHIWIPLLSHFYIQKDLFQSCYKNLSDNVGQPQEIQTLLLITFVLFSFFGIIQGIHVVQANLIIKDTMSSTDEKNRLSIFNSHISILNTKIAMVYNFFSVFSKLIFEGLILSVYIFSN